ncbi:MAG: amidohydrolase [Thermomicrobiales bacterium]
MADVAALKAAARHEVEQISRMLIGCSDWMADNPELGLQEYQASAKLSEMLEEFGAEVERGIAGLDTAFRATLPGGDPDGPTIAIIAEYDALPEVGHGCGHNIIANAAIGAGIALARLGQQGLLPGRVVILGTPAEESAVPNAGGKIPVLAHGYFADVDAAIMIHPSTAVDSVSLGPSMVAYGIDFIFHGRAAHAASNPHTGINALDAVIQTFNNIGMLRQQIRSEARIHGVVTSGGGAPNVIPPYAACRFRIRSYDPVYAAALKKRVIACAEGAATATGARLEWHEYMQPYQSYVPNHALGAVMRANMDALGRTVDDGPMREAGGYSTDFGNVSHAIPAMCASFAICDEEAGWHSQAVAAATKTDRGHASLIAAAQTMAMTAIDLLTNPEAIAAAKEEHAAAMTPIREGLANIEAADAS